MSIFRKDNLIKALFVPIVIVLAIVFSPLLLLMWLKWLINGLWLNICFRVKWGKKDKHILYVYSESPNWQQYIENNIAPKIDQKTVFLNWSKRSEWKNKKPLETKVLEYWGGEAEFNPLAVVFLPKGKVKVIRFHQAFKDYRHGKNTLLKNREAELYGVL